MGVLAFVAHTQRDTICARPCCGEEQLQKCRQTVDLVPLMMEGGMPGRLLQSYLGGQNAQRRVELCLPLGLLDGVGDGNIGWAVCVPESRAVGGEGLYGDGVKP